MWNAALWGAISGSAVLLGALGAIFLHIPKKVIGDIMACGTGVLIGAASFELLGESVHKGGITATATGFLAGALLFTIFDCIISKRGAKHRKRSGKSSQTAGMAIFIGTVIDAIPESMMLGASLIGRQSVSWLLVVAIFLSNLPEGLSSTSGLMNGGYSKPKIFTLWLSVLVISSLSAWAGYFFLAKAPDFVMAGIASFAGGGIIAMVSSTMMPEAYEDSGPVTGMFAAIGLLISLLLDHLSG